MKERDIAKTIFVLLLLSPFLASLILAYGVPSILCALMSFTDMSLDFKFKWSTPIYKNYIRMFAIKDPRIPEVFWVTLIYVSLTLLINSGFALLLGILTTYCVKNETVSSIIRTLWFLPRVTPVTIYALLWLWFADSRVGPLTILSRMIGLGRVSWILDKPYSQILMIVVNGYVGASWGMVIFSSAIKTIPLEMLYAAKVDGARDLDVIKGIIIPLLKWPILFVTAWQTLSLLGSYVQIMTIWSAPSVAGVEVWSLYTYNQAFLAYEFGYSAALAMIIVVISLFLLAVYFKVFGFKRMIEPSRIEV